MDPLGQVYQGQAGSGAAVILGESKGEAAGKYLDRLNALSKQRAAERKAVDKAMGDLEALDEVGWFRHNEELGIMREELINHTTNVYVAGGDPFSGKAGLKTAQLQGSLSRSAKHSQQIRELYKLGTTRIEGKQENFTPESITAFANYFTLPLGEQLKSSPPTLVEKKEVVDYLSFIDKQATGTAFTQYEIKKDGKTTFSKQANAAAVKLRIEDTIASPQGQAAISDRVQNHGETREQAEQWIENRFRSNLDRQTKSLENQPKGGAFMYFGWGAKSANYRFEYQEVQPTVGVGTILDPDYQQESFEEISLIRTNVPENTPINLRDPGDPSKQSEILVIPIALRRGKDGKWILHGKKRIAEYGRDYTETYEIPWDDVKGKIRGEFDGFDPDIFMDNYQGPAGTGPKNKKKEPTAPAAPTEAKKVDYSKYKRK